MKLFGFTVFLICFGANAAQIQGPITQDFQSWLNVNGYSQYNFARTDLGNYGSYGGKQSDPTVIKQPVIFVHGNSDQALKNPSCSNSLYCQYETGWTNSIQYFLSQGYTSFNLYATTWGDANPANAQQHTHNCANVMMVRKFIEAVIAYTGAQQVDVISHSMGVTLARKALQGGSMTDETGTTCNVGSPLTGSVDTFLGISGGNYGLCNCQYTSIMPTCNKNTGYYPGTCGANFICGYTLTSCTQTGYAQYLMNLNAGSGYEGANRYAFWSTADEILGFQANTWGQPTPRFPGMTARKVYTGLTHMQTKDNTASDQYAAVVNHSVAANEKA